MIEVKNLHKTYESSATSNVIIENLELSVQQGEFVVIMGRSGSGKSTLLYMLSGLDKITDGEVWVMKTPIHQKSEKALSIFRRDNVGFIFQDPNLIPNLSVLENILIAGYLSSKNKKEKLKQTHVLLKSIDLLDLKDRLPSELSGGQQQRAAIGRALINSPTILMADEPTGNLNSSSARSILSLFKEIHKSGQTILMVTHDVMSACMGERILFFQDGKIFDEMKFSSEINESERFVKLNAWLLEKGW